MSVPNTMRVGPFTPTVLVKKRYLDAFKGEPTSVRGGQSKRYYKLTQHGHEVLMDSRKTQESFWQGLPDFSFQSEKSNE